MRLLRHLRPPGPNDRPGPAVVVVTGLMAAYRPGMHPHRAQSVPAPRVCDADRVRYLHLVAAARATAVRPESHQQIADIVRVTVDDEVDTGTFTAIVSDVATDLLGRRA
jgi:hypothetical protein